MHSHIICGQLTHYKRKELIVFACFLGVIKAHLVCLVCYLSGQLTNHRAVHPSGHLLSYIEGNLINAAKNEKFLSSIPAPNLSPLYFNISKHLLINSVNTGN